MVSLNNIDRLFPPQHFNDTTTNNILIHKEKAIVIFARNNKTKDIYNTFDTQFSTYLTKLPSNNVKKYISNIFQKKLVYFGIANSARNDAVFTRVCMTDDKLAAVVLDSGLLDIDIQTGETANIDDCIYASYFGLIRASILGDKQGIKNDLDLHKLLSTYVFQIILRAVGVRSVYTDKQKQVIHMACIYAFHRHFFNEKHSAALSILKKDYSQFFNKDIFNEVLPLFDTVSKYSSLQDIPKILIDLHVFYGQPAQINMSLLSILGINYHNFVGPLDTFISMIIVSRYPSNLINKGAVVTDKIHEGIEQLMVPYLDKLGYMPTSLLTAVMKG